MSVSSGREVATAYATIVPRAPNFARNLEREVRPDLRRVGDLFGDDLARSIDSRLERGLDGADIGRDVGADLTDAVLAELAASSLDRAATRLGDRVGGRLGDAAGDEIEREIEASLDDATDGGSRDGLGYGRDFERGFERGTSGIGKTLRAGLVGAGVAVLGGLTLGGVAVSRFVGDSVRAGVDLNETLSATGELFGSSADDAERFAENAGRLNLTRQEALSGLNTFGLFTNLITDDDEEAVARAVELTERAADLGSFFNASADEVQGAFSSALRGEFEPIRQFGVLLSADALAAAALSEGIIQAEVDATKLADAQLKLREAQEKAAEASTSPTSSLLDREQADLGVIKAEEELAALLEGKVPQLTQAQALEAAYAEILRQTSTAQGDLARTSESAANQERALITAYEREKEALGEELLPIYSEFLGLIKDEGVPILEDFAQFIGDNSDDLLGLARSLATGGAVTAAVFLGLGASVAGLNGAVLAGVSGITGALADLLDSASNLPEPLRLLLFGTSDATFLEDRAEGLREISDRTGEASEQAFTLAEGFRDGGETALDLVEAIDQIGREDITIGVGFEVDENSLGSALASIPRGVNFNPDAPAASLGGSPAGSGAVNITVRDADGILQGNVRGQIDSTLTAAQRSARNKAAGAT